MAARCRNLNNYFSNPFACQRRADISAQAMVCSYTMVQITGVDVPEDHRLGKLIRGCCEIT